MANIHCPKCDAEVSSLSLACPACGASLTAAKPVPSSTISCPKCGAEVSSLSMACPACGVSLANVQSAPLPWTQAPRPTASFGTLFWGVLTAPTATFEDILAGPRQQHVWKMLLLAGFFSCLEKASEKGEFLYVLAFPIAALISYLVLWIAAWLLALVGGWLGGTGDIPELYDYLIWAQAPGMIFNFVTFIRNGSQLEIWRLGWGVVMVAVAIGAFVISLLLLATAHRYSAWMAFWTSVLVVLLPTIILLIIFVPILMFLGLANHF